MLTVAKLEDLELVKTMAFKFADASPYADIVDKDKVEAILKEFLTNTDNTKIILLYGDKGMVAGLASEFIFGKIKIVSDFAWWVEPEARKEGIGELLLNALEFWGKAIGCERSVLTCLDDKLGKYYEKRGYHKYEYSFMKALD